jgi:hypothetical protein
MAKNSSPRIDDDRWYSVKEAEPLLDLTAETIKQKCRSGDIKGVQKGPRKKWYIKGAEIKRYRKAWNLD